MADTFFKINILEFAKTRTSVFFIYCIEKPIYALNSVKDSINSYQGLLTERACLKEELAELKKITQAQTLQLEDLSSLKKMLEGIDYVETTPKPARVLGTHSIFPHAVLYASLPVDTDVLKDQLVLSENGLVGRVVQKAGKSVKIMLITDHYSRIPVRLKKTGEQALLTGQGTNELKVSFLERAPDPDFLKNIPLDDVFVTSGIDDVFTPNIPVAQIARTQNGEVFAKPLCDFNTLQFVQIQ
jgi:rod shape-determining protein MreC